MEESARRALFAAVMAAGFVLGCSPQTGLTQAQTHTGPSALCTFDHTMLRTRPGTCRPQALIYPPSVRSRVERAIYNAALTFGVPYPTLLHVATCESGLQPHATNGTYQGLFQFLPATYRRGASQLHHEVGITTRSIWNPADSSYVAGFLFATAQAPSWGSCLPSFAAAPARMTDFYSGGRQ